MNGKYILIYYHYGIKSTMNGKIMINNCKKEKEKNQKKKNILYVSKYFIKYIDNDVYMYPVEEIHTSYSCDYKEHLKNTEKRILEKLRYGTLL